jgi:two-component SAPR family response regulator
LKSLVILMIEKEQPEGLSARKLVIETVKHNVLTAYDAETGFDLLRRFPNVDAILVHGLLLKEREDLLREIRAIAPKVRIILATPYRDHRSDEADYVINSHSPQDLLKLLGDYW